MRVRRVILKIPSKRVCQDVDGTLVFFEDPEQAVLAIMRGVASPGRIVELREGSR